MKFKWKKPHDLYPRLVQILLTAGAAGLLYTGAAGSTEGYPAASTYVETAESGSSSTTESESLSAQKNTEPEDASVQKDTKPEDISEQEHKESENASVQEHKESECADRLTESVDSSDYVIVEYADGSPYAPSESTLSILWDDLAVMYRFQPDYLSDLTQISLSWDHLEQEITSMTESWSGSWSVYVKNLTNEEIISINPHPMESASLIKLYIMGAVMEQIYDGTLEETDTIDRLLTEMISVSDNEAANELVRYLSRDHDHRDGLSYVNSFARRHGFSDTQQVNGLEDSRLWHEPSSRNETSARDCGELLSQIYNGKLISHLASRKMETLLLGQEITYKIPCVLPDEAVSASKTGEISDAEHDSAIIYSPGGDFVLCIMSSGWDSGNQAITHIREITRMVYRHFNPENMSKQPFFEEK